MCLIYCQGLRPSPRLSPNRVASTSCSLHNSNNSPSSKTTCSPICKWAANLNLPNSNNNQVEAVHLVSWRSLNNSSHPNSNNHSRTTIFLVDLAWDNRLSNQLNRSRHLPHNPPPLTGILSHQHLHNLSLRLSLCKQVPQLILSETTTTSLASNQPLLNRHNNKTWVT